MIRLAANRGRRRFEDPAHLHQLEGEVVEEQVGGGADAGEQQLGPQAGDERAVAPANLQYTGGDQGAHRLAHRVAAGAQRLGELGLGRETLAGRQATGGDQLADLLDCGFGQADAAIGRPPSSRQSGLDMGCLSAYGTACRRTVGDVGDRTRGGGDEHVGERRPSGRSRCRRLVPSSTTRRPPTPWTASRTRTPVRIGRYRLLRGALTVIRLGPVLILAGLVVAMTLLSPVFLTTGNVGNILSQTAAIAVLAIGQLLVILTRGIDLSVGSTLALASVLGALAFQQRQRRRGGHRRHARHGRGGRLRQRRRLRVGPACPTRSSSPWRR